MAFMSNEYYVGSSTDDEKDDESYDFKTIGTIGHRVSWKKEDLQSVGKNHTSLKLPSLTSESSEDEDDGSSGILDTKKLKRRFYSEQSAESCIKINDKLSQGLQAKDGPALIAQMKSMHENEELKTFDGETLVDETYGDHKAACELVNDSSRITSHDDVSRSIETVGDEGPHDTCTESSSSVHSIEQEHGIHMSDSGVFESPCLTISSATNEHIEKALSLIQKNKLSFPNSHLPSMTVTEIPTDESISSDNKLLTLIKGFANQQKAQSEKEDTLLSQEWEDAPLSQRLRTDGTNKENSRITSDTLSHVVTSWSDIRAKHKPETTEKEAVFKDTILLDLRPKVEDSPRKGKNWRLPDDVLPSIYYPGASVLERYGSRSSSDEEENLSAWNEARKKIKLQSVMASDEKRRQPTNTVIHNYSKAFVDVPNETLAKEECLDDTSPPCGCEADLSKQRLLTRGSKLETKSSVMKTENGYTHFTGNRSDSSFTENKTLIDFSNHALSIEDKASAAPRGMTALPPESMSTSSTGPSENSLANHKLSLLKEISRPAIEALDAHNLETPCFLNVCSSSSDESSLDEEPVAFTLQMSFPTGYTSAVKKDKSFPVSLGKRGSFGSYDLVVPVNERSEEAAPPNDIVCYADPKEAACSLGMHKEDFSGAGEYEEMRSFEDNAYFVSGNRASSLLSAVEQYNGPIYAVSRKSEPSLSKLKEHNSSPGNAVSLAMGYEDRNSLVDTSKMEVRTGKDVTTKRELTSGALERIDDLKSMSKPSQGPHLNSSHPEKSWVEESPKQKFTITSRTMLNATTFPDKDLSSSKPEDPDKGLGLTEKHEIADFEAAEEKNSHGLGPDNGVLDDCKSKKKSKRKLNKKSEARTDNLKGVTLTKGADTTSHECQSHPSEVKKADSKNRVRAGDKKSDSEKTRIRAIIRRFLRENDFPPLLYEDEVSFWEDIAAVDSRALNQSQLLLTIPLQAPGICQRHSNSKNNVSVSDGTNAYVGLSALFLSLVPRQDVDIAAKLEVPFSVIGFQQIVLENDLKLCIGVTENDVTSSHMKRGKSSKTRKTFYHLVNQFLNLTDFEVILCKLEKVMLTKLREPVLPSTSIGKLSSWVAVHPDENALTRIFSLPPSLFWKSENRFGPAVSSLVTFLPPKEHQTEITILTLENFVSLPPKELLYLYSKVLVMDLVGVRLAYLKPKDSLPDKAVLVMALSDIASTSYQCALKLVPVLFRDTFISTGYSPRDLENMENYTGGPLITYSIGRRRADRESALWFGKRLNNITDNELVNELDSYQKEKSKNFLKSKADFSPSHLHSAYFLTNVMSRILFLVSSIVPSAFLARVLETFERVGLTLLCIGKVLCSTDMENALGTLNYKSEVENGKTKSSPYNSEGKHFWIFLLEGQNSMLRAARTIETLAEDLRKVLSSGSISESTQSVFFEKDRFPVLESAKYFLKLFRTSPLTSKNAQYIEEMCTVPSPTLGSTMKFEEFKSDVTFRARFSMQQNEMEVCVLVITGDGYREHLLTIIKDILKHSSDITKDSGIPKRSKNGFYDTWSNRVEMLGVKSIPKINQFIADEVNPIPLGGHDRSIISQNILGHHLFILLLRGWRAKRCIEDKVDKLKRSLCSQLNKENPTEDFLSAHNFFLYNQVMTVIKFMTLFFDPADLCFDGMFSVPPESVWPLYLEEQHWLFKRTNPMPVPANVVKSVTLRKSDSVNSSKDAAVKIVHPLLLNVPLQILLEQESVGFSVLRVEVNRKHPKVLPKALFKLLRDGFTIVGLRYPRRCQGKAAEPHDMLVVLRRKDALARISGWLSSFEYDVDGKHLFSATVTTAEALESISSNFVTSAGGGIFDWGCLSLTEKLSFTHDEIFDHRHDRRVVWLESRLSENLLDSTEDNTGLTTTKSSLMEVNVILISNGILRRKYLDRDLPDSLRYLGLWERMSHLAFETIGLRMTSLSGKELGALLDECEVDKERRVLEYTLSARNGPFLAMAVVREFSMTNFWTTISREYNAEELTFLRRNLLVPSKVGQVEVLLRALFDSLSENPMVRIEGYPFTKS